jgi:drug/metabolite transporter (DMT)-like permease
MLGESPGGRFWYWVPPALAGAYLVSAPDWRSGLRLDPRQPLPPAAALVAAALWAACTVLGRYASGRVSPVALTGLRFLLALPLLAILYALQSPVDRRLPSTASEVVLLVAMALGPGLLALLLYYRGLQSTIAPMASVAELAFPLTAVLTNWIFLDVRLSGLQLAGGALLVLSITALGYFGPRPGHND